MPIVTFRAVLKDVALPLPGIAVRSGLRLQCELTLHPEATKHITDEGGELPKPVTGMALIDTGASVTSIDEAAARSLNLQQIDVITMGTAKGTSQQPVYAFAGDLTGVWSFVSARGAGCDLKAQGLVLLVGMDLLSQCMLIVNGPDNSFVIAH